MFKVSFGKIKYFKQCLSFENHGWHPPNVKQVLSIWKQPTLPSAIFMVIKSLQPNFYRTICVFIYALLNLLHFDISFQWTIKYVILSSYSQRNTTSSHPTLPAKLPLDWLMLTKNRVVCSKELTALGSYPSIWLKNSFLNQFQLNQCI